MADQTLDSPSPKLTRIERDRARQTSPEAAMAIVERFVAACCVEEPKASIRFIELYGDYLSWVASIDGASPLSTRHFSRALTARGAPRKATKRGVVLLGLATASEPEPAPKPKRTPSRIPRFPREQILLALRRFIKAECLTGYGPDGVLYTVRTKAAFERYKSWYKVNKDPTAEARAALNGDPTILVPGKLGLAWFVEGLRTLGLRKKRTRVYVEEGYSRTQASECVIVGLALR